MADIESIPFSTDPRRINLPGRILVAHQAEFLPWLGYISKASMGDIFLVLDDTQFKIKYFENRNKIRFPNDAGWFWLNVPIRSTGALQNMMDVELLNFDWVKKHLKTIEISYARAPFFEETYFELKDIYLNFNSNKLIDLNLALVRYGFKKFRINVPVLRVSELKNSGKIIDGKSTDLVVSLISAVNAQVLVAGISGANYLELNKFISKGMKVVFQDFKHPIYEQYHNGFLPYMSFIDLLFNHGVENSIKILGKCNYKEVD